MSETSPIKVVQAGCGGLRDLMAQPLLVDMAIHTFDAARFLAALDSVSVFCKSFNPNGSWFGGDACALGFST